jgi:hypothetical protein
MISYIIMFIQVLLMNVKMSTNVQVEIDCAYKSTQTTYKKVCFASNRKIILINGGKYKCYQ